MSDPRTDLPSAQSANFNQRIRETLMTYLGRQGNPLDRGLTVRDLIAAGLVQVVAGKTLKPGAGTPPIEPKPGATNEEPDLTPPPTPTGFEVSAAISHVFIEHDAPLYRQGHGHLRTRVYGKVVQDGDPAPTFADAAEVAQFSGSIFALPTNPATTWHLWIKWESVDGVLSVAPAGGTNGLSVTAGQDVSLLLEALTGEITESQLYADLGSRIDLIDGDATLAGSVNFRLAEEAAARAAAIAAEAQSRNDAVAAEASERNEQLSVEARMRPLQVQEAAEAVLRAVVAVENERIDRQKDVVLARSELRTDFEAGLLAEAAARLELTAVVNTNVADILIEQKARADADSAIALDVSTLFTQIGDNVAAIQDEAKARSDAVSAEASARNLLATQFRGSYTGTDINAVTEGLIYQERLARSTQDNALAQQITLLSAGAGEQFDWKAIWYFDDGVEGWTGNGTPTVSQGWLRPADQASDAYVVSPTGIDSDGNKYSQVRLRIRKTGTPTFAGYLWWRAAADTTWDTARRVTLTEPTFDANGIGLITVSPAWAVTIDRLRVDLSSAQTATDYFEIDWVAVGRPSPGASSAQLLEEQETRANADLAEANSRKTLSSILVGQEDPTGLTLPSLTSGLLYEEKQARSTQDGALATSISTLQATVTSNFNTLDAAITTEEEARIDAVSAEASARQTLTSVLLGTTDLTGLTLETLASGLIYEERETRVTQDSALATSISGLSASLGDVQADILTLQETTADLNGSTARVEQTLVASDRRTGLALDEQAAAALRDVLTLDEESRRIKATLAVISEDLTVKIEEGLLAEAQARLVVAARVDANTASLQEEITVRTRQNEATTIQLTTLTSRVDQNAASITLESQTRSTADTALASQISTLASAVGANTAAITAESAARANADSALSTQITTLSASVEANAAALQTEATTRANAISAEANARQTLQATVESNNNLLTAAIQTEANVRAEQTGALSGKYTIKVDLAGHASGFGLASEANVNEAPTSRFGIRANQFFIAPPSVSSATAPTTGLYKGYVWVDTSVTPNVTRYYTGTTWSTEPQNLLFSVQTTPTVINGVSVPAGVYMADAFIQNGTITNLKIGDQAVDNSKIANVSVSKLTAGSLDVGEYMQSTGFISGSAGFRIDGNGNAEFNNGVFRGSGSFAGEITASSGSIGAILIGSDNIRSTNFSAGSAGWRLKSDGTAEFGAAAIRGQLTADQINTNGLTIKDTGGTVVFSATVPLAGAYIANAAITTAKIGDAQITTAKIGDLAVSTLKIADEAVTIPRYAHVATGSTNTYNQTATGTGVVWSGGPNGASGSFIEAAYPGPSSGTQAVIVALTVDKPGTYLQIEVQGGGSYDDYASGIEIFWKDSSGTVLGTDEIYRVRYSTSPGGAFPTTLVSSISRRVTIPANTAVIGIRGFSYVYNGTLNSVNTLTSVPASLVVLGCKK